MNSDYLSQLPVDVFIKGITYLPFDNVITICTSNTTLHNYCSDPKYNTIWKSVIDDTFGSIYDYQNKLKQIKSKLKLGENVYNYLVYTQLVKLLDPITQLMIYYRQDDMKSFDNPHYNNIQRFLSMFVLDKKDKMKKYLPSGDYLPFIKMLNNEIISKDDINRMLIVMAQEGNIKGVSMMLSKKGNVHAQKNMAVVLASQNGYLDVVRYLVEKGAKIHAQQDKSLVEASQKGHLDVVRYLVENGADIHAHHDEPLRLASANGHLDVVKYLVKRGANIHARDDEALKSARENEHFEVANYLSKKGSDIFTRTHSQTYAHSNDYNRDNFARLFDQNRRFETGMYLIEK